MTDRVRQRRNRHAPHSRPRSPRLRSPRAARRVAAPELVTLIDAADRVRRATGACVLIVHHTGKDAGQGARGSSALRAAADTELEVKGTDTGQTTVRVTKAKDSLPIQPIRLVRTIVDVTIDGTETTSCVLLPDHGQRDAEQLTGKAEVALATLGRIEVPGGIASTVWMRSAVDEGMSERSFYEARKALVDRGLVVNLGSEKRPQYLTAERAQEDAE